MDLAQAGGALEGIRVLDLGLLVQGPQAAQLLRDLGADVIKVELPGVGDQARWIPLSMEDLRAPYFLGCNRGKRSLALDLRKERGREIFLRLVESADVVISNFVPGTMEGWGLGYEALAERNPRIVFGAGSTFGPLGADAGRRGADIAGQASGGLIHATGWSSEDLSPVGVTIADHVGSQNLAAGILAALLARVRTGRGQKVEVSLLGGQIYAQASEYTYAFLTGQQPGQAAGGHALIPMIYGILPTADGHIVMVGVPQDQREGFFASVGRPDLAADVRFEALILTPELRVELFAALAETFRKKTTAEWDEILRKGDFRFAVVRDYLEVASDPAVFENGYLQWVEDAESGRRPAVGSPIRLSDTPAQPGTQAPELGQHSEEILVELGVDWGEIAKLRADEVI